MIRQIGAQWGMVAGLALAAGGAWAAEYTAARSGRFNASDGDTWGAGIGVYPGTGGDVAIIASTSTVTALSAGEVPTGVTVKVSGNGTLWFRDSGATIDWSGITVNVNTGGTWQVDRYNTIAADSYLALNGGRLRLTHYWAIFYGTVTVIDDSKVEIVSYPTFSPVAHGSGRLTMIGSGVDSRTAIGFRNGSTWTGDWDMAYTGQVRFGGGTAQITNTFPRGLRLGPGAAVNSLNGGPARLLGTVTGNGALTGYRAHTWEVGTGGILSPGEAGVNNGAGNLAVTNGETGYLVGLKFASNSTYEVDIRGTANTQYDSVSVRGFGTSIGRAEITSGAMLTVNLWTPAADTTLDATILHCGSSGGSVSGLFSRVTWNADSRWKGLAVTNVSNDVHVTGDYVRFAPGMVFLVQ